MRHRFLLYRLSHTILVVDISEIGLPNEIFPPEGKRQVVPTIRFQSWKDVERCLLGFGADAQSLKSASGRFERDGFDVLTIV